MNPSQIKSLTVELAGAVASGPMGGSRCRS